jgi:hypothetical protein
MSNDKFNQDKFNQDKFNQDKFNQDKFNQDIKTYQKNLKDDSETRQFYIEARNDDEDTLDKFYIEDNEIVSEEEPIIQKPKKMKKDYSNIVNSNKFVRSNGVNTIEQTIISLYENASKELNKTKEQLYKIKNQNELEEVKMRYLRLELNNSQVELENKTKELTDEKKTVIALRKLINTNEQEIKKRDSQLYEISKNYENEKIKRIITQKQKYYSSIFNVVLTIIVLISFLKIYL